MKIICAKSQCEKNKTLLLINTKFPPSTTSAVKLILFERERKWIQIPRLQTRQKKGYIQKKVNATYIM